MNEDEMFALFWKLLAAVLCVFVVSIASYTTYRNQAIKEVVLQGTSPIAAACAFAVDGSGHTCFALSLIQPVKKEESMK